MATELNHDGLPVRFGRDQGARNSRAGVTMGAGKERELVLKVDLEGAARTIFTMDRNRDGTLDGFATGLDTPLPDDALILGFDLITHEAPAGGTSYSIGTFQVDGTAIDADGIRTDAGAAGAQVGTQLSQLAYVSVKTIGTYTAGILTIRVRYTTA